MQVIHLFLKWIIINTTNSNQKNKTLIRYSRHGVEQFDSASQSYNMFQLDTVFLELVSQVTMPKQC